MYLLMKHFGKFVCSSSRRIFGIRRAVHKTAALCGNAACEAKSTNRTTCTLIPGDGVYPDLVCAMLKVFDAIKVPVDFEQFHLSEIEPYEKSAKLEDVVASIKKNKICLKGVLATPQCGQDCDPKTLNMKFRNALDLYANIVQVRSLPGLKLRHSGIDTVIIREMIEGEYSALEHEVVKGIVECLKIVTARNSLRIAEFAFNYAAKNNRKKITAVHKANIMKLSDGLFLSSCKTISEQYPGIQFDQMIVDNATMQLVSNPQQFDIMLTPNLYGNIVDNMGAGLVGGAGVVASASYSKDVAVFEPAARHPFVAAAGKDIANPTAMFLCGTDLLRHINLPLYSDMIEKSLYAVLCDGRILTADVGGRCSTMDFTNAVIDGIC